MLFHGLELRLTIEKIILIGLIIYTVVPVLGGNLEPRWFGFSFSSSRRVRRASRMRRTWPLLRLPLVLNPAQIYSRRARVHQHSG